MDTTNAMFQIADANEWIDTAALQPTPERLWKSLWFKNELACLFADTNMGKSIYAVQIANEIAARETVLYFDFEMSAKQFQMRYTDPENGTMTLFNSGLKRVEMKNDIDDISLNNILVSIEDAVNQTGARVIVIDNITWLCNYTESGDTAGELMLMLIALKRRLELSILVLAHTPKRPVNAALTQNSLAGSKKLANFMDSMFAIGTDHTDTPAGRYIKQIKVRSSELEYGADSVIRARLVRRENSLHFEEMGTATEASMLAGADDGMTDARNISNEKKQLILDLKAQGKNYKAICDEAGVSTKTIAKVLREASPQ